MYRTGKALKLLTASQWLREVRPSRAGGIAAFIRRAFLGKGNRRKPLAVDPEIEHVKTVVIAHDVVKLFGLDALGQSDRLKTNSFDDYIELRDDTSGAAA
ncbi:MAG: hypothetical protein WAJ88_00790 [Pseudolabrys sp.]